MSFMKFCKGITISDTLDILSSHPWHGKICGVYNKSFNIKVDEELININKDKEAVSPHCIIADIPENFNFNVRIKNGMDVYFKNSEVSVPEANFICDISDAAVSPSMLDVKRELQPDELIYKKLSLLEKRLIEDASDKGACKYIKCLKPFLLEGKEINADIPFNSNFFFKLNDIIVFLKEKEQEKIIAAFSNFIGSGIGLTPSADDIVLGITAWLFYYSELYREFWLQTLKEFILNYGKNQTTAVSSSVLSFGADGHFSRCLNNIVFEILYGDSEIELDDAIKKMLLHGHSSGAEICMGILVGASIVSNEY